MNSIIKVENFSKKYGDFKAVDNISFTVEEGSIFAFLGPNGAGKSTTINTLCTILDKTEGNIEINTKRVDYSRIKNEVRDKLGKFFYEKTGSKPMIITVIQEV